MKAKAPSEEAMEAFGSPKFWKMISEEIMCDMSVWMLKYAESYPDDFDEVRPVDFSETLEVSGYNVITHKSRGYYWICNGCRMDLNYYDNPKDIVDAIYERNIDENLALDFPFMPDLRFCYLQVAECWMVTAWMAIELRKKGKTVEEINETYIWMRTEDGRFHKDEAILEVYDHYLERSN